MPSCIYLLIMNISTQSPIKFLFWRLEGKIALRITIDGTPANITIPKNLQQQISYMPGLNWMGNKELFQGPGAMEINNALWEMKQAVKAAYGTLNGYGASPSSKMVKEFYTGLKKGRYSDDPKGVAKYLKEGRMAGTKRTLIELLDWYNEKDVTIEGSTRVTRIAYINNMHAFLKESKLLDIQADKFNSAMMHRYIDWIRRKRRKPMQDSYISKQVHFFKSALVAGYDREYVSVNALEGFRFRYESNEHTNHLTAEQMLWLSESDFRYPTEAMPGVGELFVNPKGPQVPYYGETMQVVVDLFIFCCYTGYHYCDRDGLQDEHFIYRNDTYWIEKVRRKTKRHGATAYTKLHPKALEIINKYGGKPSNLPRLRYQTNLNYLLRLGELMGLKFRLTTGIARNTFAHHCLNTWGFDLETTAAMMGLMDTKTIRKYAKVERGRVDSQVDWEVVGAHPSPQVVQQCKPVVHGIFKVYRTGA